MDFLNVPSKEGPGPITAETEEEAAEAETSVPREMFPGAVVVIAITH
jgi:hypothetical protein